MSKSSAQAELLVPEFCQVKLHAYEIPSCLSQGRGSSSPFRGTQERLKALVHKAFFVMSIKLIRLGPSVY